MRDMYDKLRVMQSPMRSDQCDAYSFGRPIVQKDSHGNTQNNDVSIEDDFNMIMVPNSCFSVLHVPYSYDKITNTSTINMTLPGTGLSELWEGRWMDLVLEFGSS